MNKNPLLRTGQTAVVVKKPYNLQSKIKPTEFALKIFTDASNTGWSAHTNENVTKSFWSIKEKLLHINDLDLHAAFY